ncbi:MAG TPA: hypothetical protein VJ385_16995 [Fibrobacteria bacterium]|nr:hypothetical protein [Fibrobacteria bacterium]
MSAPRTFPPRPRGIAKRLALSAAFAFCAGVCGGCLMDPASADGQAAPAESDASAEPTALRDQSASVPGVPRGCSREWSATAMDSVLYCPDVRPPKPR